ncbi:MAG: beta-CASP ribonuclease aCPSF1, partial [Candidatus Aenigmatarchaeota archaeon]
MVITINAEIVEEIKQLLPSNAMISDICYEGSEIILYTKSSAFFKSSGDLIRRIVGKVKKRIEIRADPSILIDEETTEKIIKEIVPSDAGIKDIYFEPEFAKVVIHAEKPGLVIGKGGETLLSIKERTMWMPDIKRAPVIDSEVIRSIRKMMHREAGNRKKFLDKLGKKIYSQGKPTEWVRLACLGAFREVGRSCLYVQTPESKILMDCGLGMANIKQYPYLDSPELHFQELDAIIVSHSHHDHCGMVPYLYEYGYSGPIYCTKPTRDLMVLMQLDFLHICQRENQKAPYTSKSIEKMIKHCVPLEYGEVSDITPDVRLTLQNAGHLLGSSCVHLHIGEGLFNLVYTGDIKFENTMLFERASTDYARSEALIIESTYGSAADNLPSHREGENTLLQHIRKTAQRGGKAIIPTFAVGRGQDVIAVLAESDIDIPIYLDGMLWDATAIHTAYPEFMARNIQTKILHKGENPFLDPRLKGIGSQKEREEVLNSSGPAVILSTSGMMNGGPVMEYVSRFAEDPKNSLIFVGYQAEGTTGRRIQKGWKDI